MVEEVRRTTQWAVNGRCHRQSQARCGAMPVVSWLRKADDHHHINVAELDEAMLKGVNLCIKWGVKDITIKTDSAKVKGWLGVTMSEERRVKTNGAAELLH